MARLNWKDILVKLIQNIFKSWAKDRGIRTSPRTWHQHFVPHEDGWAIKREGNKTYTSVHKKQSTAINKAKVIAKRHDSDVIIHGADGAIRDRLSY